MDVDVLDYATPVTYSNMEKILNLKDQLTSNIIDIESINKNIEKIKLVTPEDFDSLEDLYFKEFKLYMDHAGILDDLLNYLDNEPRTQDNELMLARIERDMQNLKKIVVVQL